MVKRRCGGVSKGSVVVKLGERGHLFEFESGRGFGFGSGGSELDTKLCSEKEVITWEPCSKVRSAKVN